MTQRAITSRQARIPRAQRGMVSILAAMFLVAAVIFVLGQTLGISGKTSIDNQQQLDSTAALFLAESGIESAQSQLRTTAIAGAYTDATCTGLNGQAAALGRGSYQYTPAPVSAPTVCGGVNPACNSCTLTVKGMVGSAARSVQAVLTALPSNGVEGQTNSGNQAVNGTPSFTMILSSLQDNAYAFSHLAWNPVTNWGGAAVSSICQSGSTGNPITTCGQSWLLDGLYYNNTSSQGVLAPVPYSGTYSITTSLNDTSSTDKRRNYVMVGLIFSPVNRSSGGTVVTKGSYSQPLSSCSSSSLTAARTQPATYYYSTTMSANASACWTLNGSNFTAAYQTGNLPSGWTCNANSATTANWDNAALSDTLLVGFGGKPYRASGNCSPSPRSLTGLSLNSQPFYKGVELTGTQCDQMYSQIWYAYNPAYSTTNMAHNGAAFSGSIGASFTGAIGATFSGSISGTTLTVSAPGLSGLLNSGDIITSTGSGTNVRSNTTVLSQLTGTAGQAGTYLVSGSNQTIASRSMTAASSVLVVGSTPTAGVISVGDIITSTGSGSNVISSPATTISAQSSGSAGLAGSYTVSGSAQTVSSRSMLASSTVMRLVTPPTTAALAVGNSITDGSAATSYGTIGSLLTGTLNQANSSYLLSGATARLVPNAANNMVAFSDARGTSRITLSGSSSAIPAVGTALGVIYGTGQFLPDTCSSGTISGTTLVVSGCSATELSAGDAIFGPHVLPRTQIVSQLSGTTGGNGSYTVSRSQTTPAAGAILARAAVTGIPAANSFTVSRRPDIALKGAGLCGGLCPLLLGDGTNPVGRFNLTGIAPSSPSNQYDDWSAGFTCLSGVDPDTIKPLGTVLAKRSGWSEPVR